MNQDNDGAICSILRIGELRFMLDCGCNEKIDKDMLRMVEAEAKNVDYILLSHASFVHVGALAYLTAQNVKIPVIGTSPVAKLGA